MRLTCPLCGPRDRREFTYLGADTALSRPPEGADAATWDAYLHLRENPAGWLRDLWYHEAGCGAWLRVERNTLTHDVREVELVTKVVAGAAPKARGKRAAVVAQASETNGERG